MEKPILPRGFKDKTASHLYTEMSLIRIMGQILELYAFRPLQTPLLEYSSVLGKFLPDADRPNEGVFSLQDDDEKWLSLRYDLTAPLARYVAQHYETLPKPYKSYRTGPVFRNEKAGPGRFREFIQFDADIVGSPSLTSDVELCMLMSDILEKLGISRGLYVVGLNNRKILDALVELLNLDEEHKEEKKIHILRSIDKYEKFGPEGIAELLGPGRLDESGDFTKGVGLDDAAIATILALLENKRSLTSAEHLDKLEYIVDEHELGREAVKELRFMQSMIAGLGYNDRIQINPTIVRGLGYYTGPVFEAQLLFDMVNEAGEKVVFGSVAGGGRYDNLVSRFIPTEVPATGFSIGISRLLVALQFLRSKSRKKQYDGAVVILHMDSDVEAMQSYHKIASQLRKKDIPCEIYAGKASLKAQMKYADRKNAPCVIIQGSLERQKNVVQIKDLLKGAELSNLIKDNVTWRAERPAQITVPLENVVEEVQKIINE